MITDRRRASAVNASRTAAALLLTTSASSAPVSRVSSACAWLSRLPRFPLARSNSSVAYPWAQSWIACKAAALSGALPKLVCKMTPVALITGCRLGCTQLVRHSSVWFRIASKSGRGLLFPADRRICSNVERMAARLSGRPHWAIHWLARGCCKTRSTAGSLRRSFFIVGDKAAALCQPQGKFNGCQPGSQGKRQRQA